MDLQKMEQEDDEIDLLKLAKSLINKWYIILLSIVLGGMLGVCYNKFFITPMYSSSSLIYMRSGSTNISINDLSLSEDLNNDYEVIFTSRPNLNNVINDLGLDYTPAQLKSEISVSTIDNTRIIQITVTDSDPKLAKDIANSLANSGIEIVKELDSQSPYTIETAIASSTPVTSSVTKTAIIGCVAGFVLSCGVLVVIFLLDDRIISDDDLESFISLPVLSVVTEDKMYNYRKETTKHKHKHAKKEQG